MPNPNEIANCKKKVRFANEATAKAALQKIVSTWKLKKPNRSYKCSVCSGWHLSSQKKR